MVQFWQILNPDRCESMLGGIELGEVFFNGSWGHFEGKLRIPCLPSEVDEWLSGGQEVSQTDHLTNLPTEILNLILDEVSKDLYYLASFAATCKDVLVVSKPYLLKKLQSKYAPWAGARLICLGNRTYDEDLPAGFLTEQELDDAKADISESDSDEEYANRYAVLGKETYKPVDIIRRYYWVTTYTPLNEKLERGTHGVDAMSSSAVYQRDHRMFNLLCGYSIKAYPEGERVLFNLTKGECIRYQPIRELKNTNGADLSLIHALLARICWSGNEPGNNGLRLDEAQHQELGRGKWAGDRFCITTLEMMPRTPEGREWVDVSEEVAAFVFHLWRHAERGDPLCAKVVEVKAEAASEKRARSEDEVEVIVGEEQSLPKNKKAKITRTKAPKAKKAARRKSKA